MSKDLSNSFIFISTKDFSEDHLLVPRRYLPVISTEPVYDIIQINKELVEITARIKEKQKEIDAMLEDLYFT